ncbi:Protein kinase domain-containing protein [Mycena chlorophos]|uniref:Protein kinase domain-containing protein n=1 Tax=Mycena chlorophos TaxID=658473 RepID=A0A8H6TSX0_MYCCL|nr:Protein kinase domain-containing protein [Mycena chlorophos]
MPAPARHTPPYRLRGRSPTSNHLLRIHTSPQLGRQVLAPLITNLRKRPSRLRLTSDKSDDDPMPPPQVGSKRKRVLSVNENAHGGGRSTRGSGRLKRLRSDDYHQPDAGAASDMDVDVPSAAPSRWSLSDDEPLSDLTSSDEEDQEESTDHHLIHFASVKELQRLRKDHLVRLYVAAGLSDDPETLTKIEIVDSLVTAREDSDDLPPSSPRGASSDENDGDQDEDQVQTPLPALRARFAAHGLRRRATVNNDSAALTSRPSKSRSLSMGHLLGNPVASGSKVDGDSISSPVAARRRQPSRAIAAESTLRTSFPPAASSPPATRLRSRKDTNPQSLSAPLSSASASSPVTATRAIPFPATIHRTTAAAKGRGKGKGKQVEFLPLEEIEREKERQRELERAALAEESESDLTELDSEPTPTANPSPRRLRSKDKERDKLGLGKGKGKENVALMLDMRRVTPARKAKRGSLKEESEEEEEVEVQMQASEDEDEIEADALATPTRSRSRRSSHKTPIEQVERTPLVQRLRSRNRPSASMASASNEAGADGDDEQEEDDEEEVEEQEDEEAVEEEDEVVEEGEEGDEATIAVEPRRLRNGKIVGDDMEVEEDEEQEEEEDGEEADEEGEQEEEADADGEADDMECENVDLAIATAKTLVRLRRDDLVRLCETRDLEAVGTKPQLAEALLQWRDRQTDGSSPSSTGTVTGRPPSTIVHKRRRNASQPETPVLLRSHRVHIDEPITPEPQEAEVPAGEPELELDLESLGLDDREIPPDKLQKLEKIGSGGFKDVFIGKFRGRRIAISEFRGQLSAMDIKELKLLGGFDHPNIVRFLGVSIPEDTKSTPVMIISELCSNGDLFDYVRNVPAPSLNKVLAIMLDIARGLEYLHLRKPSVIHRDCKSSNILITAKGTAKIADFGLAKVKQSTRSMVRSLVGTVNWQAPELWHAHPKYNHKVDVFSCAMVYWEMLQWHQKEKKFPWEGMNEHAIYEIVGTKKQRPPTAGLRKQWCPAIVDLIERMWAQQHEDRPTMSEVVLALEEIRK